MAVTYMVQNMNASHFDANTDLHKLISTLSERDSNLTVEVEKIKGEFNVRILVLGADISFWFTKHSMFKNLNIPNDYMTEFPEIAKGAKQFNQALSIMNHLLDAQATYVEIVKALSTEGLKEEKTKDATDEGKSKKGKTSAKKTSKKTAKK